MVTIIVQDILRQKANQQILSLGHKIINVFGGPTSIDEKSIEKLSPSLYFPPIVTLEKINVLSGKELLRTSGSTRFSGPGMPGWGVPDVQKS
jgi:hypothetical protein